MVDIITVQLMHKDKIGSGKASLKAAVGSHFDGSRLILNVKGFTRLYH